MRNDRLCACGCGRPLPPEADLRRRYARGNACRQRAHRGRTVERQQAAAGSLAAAVARRDLADVLQAAITAANQRPGSVMLRVAGRLYALDAGELGELLAAWRARREISFHTRAPRAME